MSLINFKVLCYTFAFVLVFLVTKGNCQVTFDSPDIELKMLEIQISTKTQLQQTQQQIERIKQQAIKAQDDITYIRVLYDLLKIKDFRTEDTLYFRNSAFMDTLINSADASLQVKAIVRVLRAQRLHKFDHRWLNFNKAAYRTKDLKSDYGALTPLERDSIVYSDLEAALAIHAFGVDGSNLLWLSANPDVFLFDPTFEDIVFAEKINNAIDKGYNPGQGVIKAGWASLPSDKFRRMLDSVANKSEEKAGVLAGYSRWLLFHQDNPGVAMFIESLARKYIFLSTVGDSVSRQGYIDYLRQSTCSLYLEFKAHVVYQLCLILNKGGNNYLHFYNRYQFLTNENFNKSYQYLPKQALELYQQNKILIDKYPQLSQVLGLMATQILHSVVKIEMEDKFVPGETIPIKLIYKNIGKLFFRIIHLNQGEQVWNEKRFAAPELIGRKPLIADNFVLPLPDDRNNHAVWLKLPALRKGDYCLIFSDEEISATDNKVYCIPFHVTNIAIANTDERVYILDRKTGFPLTGATIQAYKNKTTVTNKVLYNVNHAGYAVVPENKADSIVVVFKDDTLGYKFDVHTNTIGDDDVYDKDTYDDLYDFYDDRLRMQIFTDRSIYRPGQTVHYKIIFLTRNPYTGAPMLFNATNVNGFFKNRFKKWLTENKAPITLIDPFDHKVDSVKLTVNNFGSFAGSFILPKTAATGNWSIEGKPEKDDRNTGGFEVEEYKRPTIELNMEKQKKMLQPGEPFVIKLKLRSFTGANLNGIPIKYSLARSGRVPNAGNGVVINDFSEISLANTGGVTNKDGELLVTVNDTMLTRHHFTDQDILNYTYSLEATATDATGEISETDGRIDISTRPVKIHIDADKIYDRRALIPLYIKTIADYEGTVSRPVNIKLYRISDPDASIIKTAEVDQWYYAESDWAKWFPVLAKTTTQVKSERVLILDTMLDDGAYQKLKLPEDKLTVGFYQLEAKCHEGTKTLGENTLNFEVFDSGSGEVANGYLDYLPFNSARPGETVTWFSWGKYDNYTIYQALYAAGNKRRSIKNIYQEVDEQTGLRRWSFRIPLDATGQLLLTRVSVYNNGIWKDEKRVYLYKTTAEPPEIIIENYRKVMAPGAKETFSISIRTNDKNIAAELLTTMYDASLDKIKKHYWELPKQEYDRTNLNTYWDYSLTSSESAGDYEQNGPVFIRGMGAGVNSDEATGLEGKVSGLGINTAEGLNEVVVVGYNTVLKKDITGSVAVVNLRGARTLMDFGQLLIVLDGVVYSGDLKSIPVASITQAMVLKGAEAEGVYGSRASTGVLIISTKGPIVLPGTDPPVIKIRKNFNETAFFFPQVHADAYGYYRFTFAIPESATEWNWKMLAYTRKAQFIYMERKLQTQMSLMMQPNMPRLLYQGDQLKLQSRITNLDTIAITGKLNCKIEDAVTGEDITAALVSNSSQKISLDKKSAGAAYFLVKVPAAQLNPLKIVISVSSAGASDAEEHIIPILSSKVFTRQSAALHFKSKPAIIIPAVKLPPDAKMYGIGISVEQKPQASLINALPWLANYSYDCAEQTFNKLRAEVTALRLMEKDTNAQREFKNESKAIEAENHRDDVLPDELTAESTPWLRMDDQMSRQRKQLFNLLDTSVTKGSVNLHLERLYKLQQSDGGLAWFDDGKSNAYISAYVLAGFAQLKKQGWRTPAMKNLQSSFIEKLVSYNEKQILLGIPGSYNLDGLYALSYWLDLETDPQALNGKITPMLNNAWQNANKMALDRQALLIICSFRYSQNKDSLYQTAKAQLDNIRQSAIEDADNGLRWKDIADSEDLTSSAEETVALLSEAFALTDKYKDIDTGMIKWLLATKQEQHWETTKGTAAAISMLEKQKEGALGVNKGFSAELSGRHEAVSDGLFNGASTAFIAEKETPGAIMLQQQGKNTNGSLTWYYFADPDHLDTINKAIKVKKQFYRLDNNRGWVEMEPGVSLKVGETIRVKLSIETASALKFVQISDPRAAAFEPKDNISGYQYGEGFSYYQSVKDTGLELFAEELPRGISEVNYELIVAMEGRFASGPVRLQCMYKPSATAYSRVESVVVN